jgi:hypothetical protein
MRQINTEVAYHPKLASQLASINEHGVEICTTCHWRFLAWGFPWHDLAPTFCGDFVYGEWNASLPHPFLGDNGIMLWKLSFSPDFLDQTNTHGRSNYLGLRIVVRIHWIPVFAHLGRLKLELTKQGGWKAGRPLVEHAHDKPDTIRHLASVHLASMFAGLGCSVGCLFPSRQKAGCRKVGRTTSFFATSS